MEDQIVKALQSKMAPTPIATESTPEPTQTLPDEPTNPRLPDAAPPDPLMLYRLYDFFNVSQGNREDGDLQARLVSIFDWAKTKSGTDDQLVCLETIRQLETQLGLTHRRDEKINSLYRWTKLDRQRQLVEREMSLV